MPLPSYIVITPVRNEVANVQRTIDSLSSQTILPKRWVIVDDGSADGTADVLEAAAHRFGWIRVVHRADRGFRKSGGGVVEAFYDGLNSLGEPEWDFLVKLDGDLAFEPDYFERCLTRFADEPVLGIGGGVVCCLENGVVKPETSGDPRFHVRGATKIYRRECWRAIAPLVQAPGWDTIDEVAANMNEWTTRTFQDIPIIQLKPTGTADGNWRNWFKNGVANYVTGYHPLFMAAKCVKRSFRQPYVVAAVGLGLGFLSGYWRKTQRVPDRRIISYLRKQQVKRLCLLPSLYD